MAHMCNAGIQRWVFSLGAALSFFSDPASWHPNSAGFPGITGVCVHVWCVHAYVCVHVCLCMCVFVCCYRHRDLICVHFCVCVWFVCVVSMCACVCFGNLIFWLSSADGIRLNSRYLSYFSHGLQYICIYMYRYTYVHIHIYIYTYAHVYVKIHGICLNSQRASTK